MIGISLQTIQPCILVVANSCVVCILIIGYTIVRDITPYVVL